MKKAPKKIVEILIKASDKYKAYKAATGMLEEYENPPECPVCHIYECTVCPLKGQCVDIGLHNEIVKAYKEAMLFWKDIVEIIEDII